MLNQGGIIETMEYIDVVNDKDEVTGVASYPDIYKKLLLHRIVHIFIFNDKGEMALQKRSKKKSFMGQAWSTSVGGHVQSGETYEHAAHRELKEELGRDVDIQFLYKDLYEDTQIQVGSKKFLTTFKAIFNGPFAFNPEEVETVSFFSLAEIKKMITRGDKFHPELLFLLEKHF